MIWINIIQKRVWQTACDNLNTNDLLPLLGLRVVIIVGDVVVEEGVAVVLVVVGVEDVVLLEWLLAQSSKSATSEFLKQSSNSGTYF